MSAQAVAPDLPGLGGSDPLPEASPEQLCETLLSFFAALGLDTMVICATGIAVPTVLELVHRHPEYVAGLMLVNPVLSALGAARKPAFIARNATTAINILGMAQRRALADLRRLFLNPEILTDLTEEKARLGLTRSGRKQASAFFDQVKPDRFEDYDEALRRFTKPLGVLWSDSDPLVAPGEMRRLRETVPNARSHLLQDSGPFVALESPSRLADALAEFGRRAW
jgi:pimeloyl-ACP methyl ester carboxylesterase